MLVKCGVGLGGESWYTDRLTDLVVTKHLNITQVLSSLPVLTTPPCKSTHLQKPYCYLIFPLWCFARIRLGVSLKTMQLLLEYWIIWEKKNILCLPKYLGFPGPKNMLSNIYLCVLSQAIVFLLLLYLWAKNNWKLSLKPFDQIVDMVISFICKSSHPCYCLWGWTI